MDWSGMIFQDWRGIARTVIVGFLAYATLVFFLRVSGKRTLAKLNAFDLVVTVALGSTLSAIVLQESVALAEGAMALALLIPCPVRRYLHFSPFDHLRSYSAFGADPACERWSILQARYASGTHN